MKGIINNRRSKPTKSVFLRLYLPTGKKLTLVLRKEEEGEYYVQCLELPGCISEGETRKEALGNIREAIKGYLEAFPEELEQLKRKRELVEITV